MPMQFLGLTFKGDEGDSPTTTDEVLAQGQGLNLRFGADLQSYKSLMDLVRNEEPNSTGKEPDSFIIETEIDAQGTKVTPLSGHPAEGGTPDSEKEFVLGEGLITLKNTIPAVVELDPKNPEVFFVRVGHHLLAMHCPSDSDPAEAALWVGLCQAVKDRNQRMGVSLPIAGALASLQGYSPSPAKPRGRPGPKPIIKPDGEIRVAMPGYAKETGMILYGGAQFRETETGDAVIRSLGKTQVRIDCDADAGLDTMQALNRLATDGPALMQVFLGLNALWLKCNPGASHETYLSITVTDLLRFMNRKEFEAGGYKAEDQQEMGKKIYLLSKVSIPMAHRKVVNHKKGTRIEETLTLGPLFMMQHMKLNKVTEDGKEVSSSTMFRYHLNEEIHAALCGDEPQFAMLSAKILSYHPDRDKLHIMLGVALAYYDKVSRRSNRRGMRSYSVSTVLEKNGIEIPKRNPGLFLKQLQRAIRDLDSDNVIVGAAITFPEDSTLTDRERVKRGVITFPPMQQEKLLLEQ